jgi:uncharacterized protein
MNHEYLEQFMKVRALFPRQAILTAVSLMLFTAGAAGQQQHPNPAGDWYGSLEVQGMKLGIVMHLAASKDGGYTATMDSPDQGAMGIPVPSVRVEGDSVLLSIPAIRGGFSGRIVNDTAMNGAWKQAGMEFPLPLVRRSAPIEIKRPQNPKKPYPYDEEEVRFDNPSAGISLAGTLTLPREGRPCAAVVMITGSGPQDRDETIFQHKPFWIIADHLTRHGIAVLRCDDRGVGSSQGSPATATSADFAGDVLAAVAYLRGRKEIDPARIGLIGHSEGGMIAPMAAQKDKGIAFLVLLAGTGVVGEEILYEQGALITRANGMAESEIKKNRAMQHTLFNVVREEADSAKAMARLVAIMREAQERESGGDTAAMQTSEVMIRAQAAQLNSPWFRFFLFYDPAVALRKTTIPVLALNGERDLQVSPLQNIPAIEAALKAAGNTRVKTMVLPQLNHLFQTAKSGAITEYGTLEETVSPVALDAMSTWIGEVTRK